jgi:hypothetical protein
VTPPRKKTKTGNYFKRMGLKPVGCGLEIPDYEKLVQLAEEADKSVSKYIRRLIEAHVRAQKTPDSFTDSQGEKSR